MWSAFDGLVAAQSVFNTICVSYIIISNCRIIITHVTCLVKADIATAGRAQSIEHGSHITRSRYAHQVTAACLYVLQLSTYNTYQANVPDTAVPFTEWCNIQSTRHPQFKYWTMTLDMELKVLRTVHQVSQRRQLPSVCSHNGTDCSLVVRS